jgi:hypothetical protein
MIISKEGRPRLDHKPSADDPLAAAIRDYREGPAAYNAIKEKDWPLHGGEDAVIQKTYGVVLNVVRDWDRPATSREGALAALRLALEENQGLGEPLISSMIAAALPFFEANGGEA